MRNGTNRSRQRQRCVCVVQAEEDGTTKEARHSQRHVLGRHRRVFRQSFIVPIARCDNWHRWTLLLYDHGSRFLRGPLPSVSETSESRGRGREGGQRGEATVQLSTFRIRIGNIPVWETGAKAEATARKARRATTDFIILDTKKERKRGMSVCVVVGLLVLTAKGGRRVKIVGYRVPYVNPGSSMSPFLRPFRYVSPVRRSCLADGFKRIVRPLLAVQLCRFKVRVTATEYRRNLESPTARQLFLSPKTQAIPKTRWCGFSRLSPLVRQL